MEQSLEVDEDLQYLYVPVDELDQLILQNETQISTLSKKTVELKRARNERSLSSRLTKSILQYFFTLLARDKMRFLDGWDRICVAHVCHAWREIAMDTEAMWSTIMCLDQHYSLHRANMHLTLSKEAELAVTFMGSTDVTVNRMKKVQSLILEQNRRIVELSVSVLEDVWKEIAETVQIPTSRTKFLHIDIQSSKYYTTFLQTKDINPQNELSAKLLSSNLLESVYLHNLELSSDCFNSFYPGNLINLTLTYIVLQSPSQLLDLLAKCNSLKHLSLIGCRTKDFLPDQGYNRNSRQVILGFLEELHLKLMDIKEIMEIMELLTVADGCNISVDCNADRNMSETFGNENFAALFLQNDCKFLDIGMFSNELYMGMTYYLNSEGEEEEEEEEEEDITFKLSIHLCWNETESLVAIFAQTANMISDGDLNTAHRVQIRVDGNKADLIEEENWKMLLVGFKKTNFLGVSFIGENTKTEEEFAKALRRRDSKNEKFTVCPNLKHLCLRFVKYTVDFSLELEYVLRIRDAYRKPIKSLWLYDIMGLKEDAKYETELAKFARKLHWERYDDDEFQSEESDFYDSDEEKGGKEEDEDKDEDDEDEDDEDEDEDEDDEDECGGDKDCGNVENEDENQEGEEVEQENTEIEEQKLENYHEDFTEAITHNYEISELDNDPVDTISESDGNFEAAEFTDSDSEDSSSSERSES